VENNRCAGYLYHAKHVPKTFRKPQKEQKSVSITYFIKIKDQYIEMYRYLFCFELEKSILLCSTPEGKRYKI
jgi:hypothetical protein